MIEKINYEVYNEFCKKMNQSHFMHSQSWAEFREKMGWTYEYIGLYEDGELYAAFLAQFKKLPKLKYKMLYIARGMIIDYENEVYVKKFALAVNSYARKNNAYVVKIDPELKRYNVDIKGNPLEEQTKAIDYLIKSGFKHKGFVNNFEGINGRHTFIVDYKDKTIDDLFKALKSNDRTKIKKAESLGVTIEESKDINVLHNLMVETGERGNYQVRPLEFFKLIKDSFIDKEYTILTSKLNLQDHLDILNDKYFEMSKEISNLNLKLDNDLNEKQIKKVQNQIKDNETKLNSLQKDLDYVKDYMKTCDKKVISLSSALYVFDEDKTWYWYGGSSNDFRHLRPVNLQMWKFIELSYNRGSLSFDLLGTGGDLSPQNKNYGLYKFKKSFGGEFIEYIGEFDMVINPYIYKLVNFILPKLQTSSTSSLLKVFGRLSK